MKAKFVLLSLFFVFIFSSCIDDVTTPTSIEEFANNALTLSEIEERGDYLNSPDFPALKTASEVYSELKNYKIIDVRSAEDYTNGHIQNAINVSNTEIFSYINDNNEDNKNLLIVSSTGQAAAYYTALFRLYGLKNIYSLNFGMSGWNKDFSYLMDSKLNNIDVAGEAFNNVDNPKPSFSQLPVLPKSSDTPISVFFTDRIKSLLAEGFDENISEGSSTKNAMGIQYFLDVIAKSILNKNMIVCSANADLFFLGQLGMLDNPGHPKGAILYKILYPVSELSSTKYLQTLPPDKPIALYSFSGQISAMETAFLQLLGYDAKSLLFGAHSIFYNRLIASDALRPFAYQKNSVEDLPYVK